jgi:hypothetical protein
MMQLRSCALLSSVFSGHTSLYRSPLSTCTCVQAGTHAGRTQ